MSMQNFLGTEFVFRSDTVSSYFDREIKTSLTESWRERNGKFGQIW